MFRFVRVLAMAFLLLALGRTPALARPDDDAFRARLDTARSLYLAGHWADARAAFLSAHEANPRPDILYFVATTYLREGNHSQALAYFERYLAEAPADDPLRPRAERMTTKLRDVLARGDLVGAPLGAPRDSRDVRDPRRLHRRLFWGTLAATGAGLVAMQLGAARVNDLKDQQLLAIERFQEDGTYLDPSDACADARNYHTAQAQEIVSICNRGKRWASITNGFMLGTVVTASAAAFFYYKGYMKPGPKRERARVTPTVSSSGVAVSLDVPF